MFLIADSGATKTDWALVSNRQLLARYQTQGLSPVHQSTDSLADILQKELFPQLSETECSGISHIYFYGAGCRGLAQQQMKTMLQNCFPVAQIEVESDLLGAARAVCGHEKGLVCILGTGSNSCLYDGETIVENIPPLGYILGDEGSGAVLGRMLLNRLFKDPTLSDLKEKFLSSYGLTYEDVIEHVYRRPLANRFLASLIPFIKENLSCKSLLELTTINFRNFLRNNILKYNTEVKSVYAVGGMTEAFHEQLSLACKEEGLQLKKTLKNPIEGLIVYHE